MNPLAKPIFDLLAKLTAPLKGYRTLIGTLGAIGLLVYAVMSGNYVLAGQMLALVLVALGLRPEEPPAEPK